MAAQNGYLSTTASGSTTPRARPRTGATAPPALSATPSRSAATATPGPEIASATSIPPYPEVVAQWDGTHAESTGGGNRAAYYVLAEAALDPKTHSVLEGRAPRRRDAAPLQGLHAPGPPVCSTADGIARRPPVLRRGPRHDDRGAEQRAVRVEHQPLDTAPRRVGQGPSRDRRPEPDADASAVRRPERASRARTSTPPTRPCWNDHAFTVPAGPGDRQRGGPDRDRLAEPVQRLGHEALRGLNGDGSSVGETQQVGSSGRGQPRLRGDVDRRAHRWRPACSTSSESSTSRPSSPTRAASPLRARTRSADRTGRAWTS